VREREVAATVLAIRAICRRFRITGFPNFTSARGKTDFTLACCYPEPEGEFLNQSTTIIGPEEGRSNLSKGRRTTKGNLGTVMKINTLERGNGYLAPPCHEVVVPIGASPSDRQGKQSGETCCPQQLVRESAELMSAMGISRQSTLDDSRTSQLGGADDNRARSLIAIRRRWARKRRPRVG